jgi:hypothetical protein
MFLFLVTALLLWQTPRGPAPITDAEVYAIYSAHLARVQPEGRVPPAPLIIQAETEYWDSPGCIREPIKSEWQEVVTDYRRTNAKVSTIQGRLRLNMPYEFVSKEALLATLGSQGNWPEFHRLHPGSGGFMSLSAIGFNADKTRAMLYSSHGCGGMCGSGGFFLFEKVNGRWMGTEPMKTCVMIS